MLPTDQRLTVPFKTVVAANSNRRAAWHIYKQVTPEVPDLHVEQGDSLCGKEGLYLREPTHWDDQILIRSESRRPYCQRCLREAEKAINAQPGVTQV